MKYIFLLLLAFLTFSPSPASAVWFSSDWDYKVKVEVNPNKVGTTTAVTSFPVYVDLAGMPASFWTNASNTGADIRVLESDETTETAFELVTFATTTKAGELHFMADALATTSTSTFYIYYGNATATAYAVTDTYGRNNVWGGYKAKWHLAETSGSAFDSTVNANTATNTNTVTYVSSKIYNGANFVRASSQRLGAPDSTSLSVTSDLSISFWLYFATLPSSGQQYGLITKDTAGTSQRSYWVDVYNPSASYQLRFGIHADGGSTNLAYSYVTHAFSTGTWYHVTAKTVPANSIGTKFEFFIDGVSKGNGTSASFGTGATSIYNSLTSTALGAYAGPGVFHNGRLDEVGILNTNLSASWIKTEYNNQSSTSTFFYIGAEEAYSAGTSTVASTTDSIIWFD